MWLTLNISIVSKALDSSKFLKISVQSPESSVQSPASRSRVQPPQSSVQSPVFRVQSPTHTYRVQELSYVRYLTILRDLFINVPVKYNSTIMQS